MSRKKDYDLGPGQTNAETSDAAAEGGSDHNEALAQRPGDGSEGSNNPDDQAALEQLKRTSQTMEAQTLAGQTTTTTPDSVAGGAGTASTSTSPGDLDKLTAEERIERVRGWAKTKRTQPPMSADWQELEQILGSRDASAVRRP